MVMLLQNCRHDTALWAREVGRLSALVKSDPLVLEQIGKQAGMDALCDLLLVTYGLDADAHASPVSANTPRYATGHQ